MTVDFTAVDTGMFTRLTNTAGTALWSTRVYEGQAPANTTFPYVVFFLVSGGEDNLNKAGSFDVDYQVECWGTALAQARSGLTYINTALHNQELTISGYANFASRQIRLIRTTENDAGVQFFRRGGLYRLRGS